MADVEVAPCSDDLPVAAPELIEVAARASAQAHEVLGSVVCAQLARLEIAVEVPGLTKRVSVQSPARPGAVRAAVTKTLRDLGLSEL